MNRGLAAKISNNEGDLPMPGLFLCAALALAAPVEKSPVHIYMNIYPESPMLGDFVIVSITAINLGKVAAPVQAEYDYPLFEIGRETSNYRYSWGGSPFAFAGGNVPLISLAPGKRRIVALEAIRLSPIGDIRREFWTELAQDKRGHIFLTARQGHWDGRPFVATEHFDDIRPRPPEEVAALLEAYSQVRSKNSVNWDGVCIFGTSLPKHFATPEKLAAFEAKLSDGTLRDALRATRLTRIVAAEKAHPRGAAQRRAAAKELIALLDESEELERQWLAHKIFGWFYGRSIHPDQIEREFVNDVVRRIPEPLASELIRHGPGQEIFWPTLTRKLKAKATGTNEQTRARQ